MPYHGKNFAFILPKYSEEYRKIYKTIPEKSLADHVWEKLQKMTNKFYPVEFQLVKYKDTAAKVVNDVHVRRREIYIVHSPCVDKILHVDIACEMADEIRRSGAREIYLFDTYDATFRQDKRQMRESVDARWTADKFQEATIDKVFTFDPHTEEIQMAFSRRCPIDTFSLTNIYAEKIYRILPKYLNDLTFCAADEGSYGKNEEIANMFHIKYKTPLVALRMRRNPRRPDLKEIIGFVGDPKDIADKVVVVREDVMGTAGTVRSLVDYLYGRISDVNGKYICNSTKDEAQKCKPRAIIIAASHLDLCKGSASGNEEKSQEKMRGSGAVVLGTNTIIHNYTQSVDMLESILKDTPIEKVLDKNSNPFYAIDISGDIAEIIHLHSQGESLSKFFLKKRDVVELGLRGSQ